MVIFNNFKLAKIFISWLAFLFIVAMLHNNAAAQSKRIAIWHVGNKRLDFNTKPVTVTEIKNKNLFGSPYSAILCDKEGKLLLFSSNEKLYDKDYKAICNINSRVNSMFIPKPNDDSLVYLINAPYYNLIDIKNNKVVDEGNCRDNKESTGVVNYSLAAISHSNCNDIWLVVNNMSDSSLRSYLLTSKGISKNYVKSKKRFNVYASKLSPTGKYYCGVAYGGQNPDSTCISFGTFNNTTGLFTETYSELFTKGLLHGIAFSPDESKLYLHFMLKKQMELYQVDIANGVPNFDNATLIHKEAHNGLGARLFTPMQLGLDGKIYKTFYFKTRRIDIIHHPNRKGKACGFQANAISLSTVGNQFPQFVTTYAAENPCELSFYSQNFCYGDYTLFNIKNVDGIKSVLWNFGDGSSSTEFSPEHYYKYPGKYTVSLQVMFTDGNIKTETQTINIVDFTELSIKQD